MSRKLSEQESKPGNPKIRAESMTGHSGDIMDKTVLVHMLLAGEGWDGENRYACIFANGDPLHVLRGNFLAA